MVFGEVFSGGVSLYRPLLDWEFDCRAFAQTMLEEVLEELKRHDKLILLSHSAHPTLETLEREFNKLNDNILFVTLGELEDLDSVRAKLPSGSKVLIQPLMIAGGVHVHRDMKSKLVTPLEADGFACTPILKGLCEYDSVCKLLVSHIIPV
jgi:cobalamin biosynthesis Co2+ chelatase CbiK